MFSPCKLFVRYKMTGKGTGTMMGGGGWGILVTAVATYNSKLLHVIHAGK